MILELLPPKHKLKIDSEMLSLISETEKSFAQLDVLSRFLPNQYFSFLKSIEAINSNNIDYSPAIELEHYLLNKESYKEVETRLSSLETAIKILKDVKPSRLIKTLHQEIVAKQNDSGGKFREDFELKNPSRKFIVPQNVVVLMNDLENYLMSDVSYHPLINAAIIHAQFELIHPFNSHNGIVGRQLTQLHFVWKKKLTKTMLMLSKALLEKKTEYFDKLQDIATNNNWDGWIKFMLSVFLKASKNSIALLETIDSFYRETVSASIKNNFASPALLKVVEFISTNPVFTIPLLTSSLSLSKQTANIILTKLLSEKIILESSGKQRYRIFKNDKIITAINL